MNLTKIAQISVRAKDLQRATAFYRDKLELKVVINTPVISIADCGGVFLLISKAESPELDHPSSVIYFEVDDIQKTVADLSSREVKIQNKPHIVGQLGDQDVWVAIFRDSEDNLVGLMSRVPRK
jgi:predicted enzyme related to lactoylglutathione lyase